MLQYTGGSNYMCNGQDRSLRLHLFCANNPHTLPNEASVVEYPMCTYNIEMQTQFACPISCGEINRKLAFAATTVTCRELAASAMMVTMALLARRTVRADPS